MADINEIQGRYNADRSSVENQEYSENQGRLNKILDADEINKQLEELRLKKFKEEHELDENSDIPEDLKSEYKKFSLTDEQKKESYEECKKEVCDVCAQRDRELKRLLGDKQQGTQGEIGDLEQTIQSEVEQRKKDVEAKQKEIEEKQSQIEQLSADPEKKGEVEALRVDVEKLNGEITTLNGEIETLTNMQKEVDDKLRQPTIKAFGDHNKLRVYAYDTLTDRYGASLTAPDMNEIAGQRGADFITDRAKQQLGIKDDKELENQQPEQSELQQEQPQQGNGRQQTGTPLQEGAPIMGGQQLTDEPLPVPTNFEILGYDDMNNLTRENAKEVLEVFTGRKPVMAGDREMSDALRMEMIKDPETLRALQRSMLCFYDNKDDGFFKKIANNFRNRGLNKELKDIMNKRLPEFANKEINEEDIKQIEEKLSGVGIKNLDDFEKKLETMNESEIKKVEDLINDDPDVETILSDRYAAYRFKTVGNDAINLENNTKFPALNPPRMIKEDDFAKRNANATRSEEEVGEIDAKNLEIEENPLLEFCSKDELKRYNELKNSDKPLTGKDKKFVEDIDYRQTSISLEKQKTNQGKSRGDE